MHSVSWSLSLELEYHNTCIMACGKQIYFWMCSNNPEPIIFSLERLDRYALVQIPDPYRFILANGQYEILMWMEKASRSILEMPAARIDLPCFGFWIKRSVMGGKIMLQCTCRSSAIALLGDRLLQTLSEVKLDGKQPN